MQGLAVEMIHCNCIIIRLTKLMQA